MPSEKNLVSVAEAARLVGRNRQTLYRDYIATGKLSTQQDQATRHKRIDISELIRVFGHITQGKNTEEQSQETVALLQQDTSELHATIAALKAENEQLKHRLDDRASHIEDLRSTLKLLELKQEKVPWWKRFI